MTDRLQSLIDRQDLTDLVNRYARGLDRCDVAQLQAVFSLDATVDMISFQGNAHAFAETTLGALRKSAATTTHLTSNCIFEIAGDRATGESYLISVSAMKDGDTPSGPAHVVSTHVARYLDRFERREGRWMIVHRAIVVDLELSGAVTAPFTLHVPAGDENRYPDDASYAQSVWLAGE